MAIINFGSNITTPYTTNISFEPTVIGEDPQKYIPNATSDKTPFNPENIPKINVPPPEPTKKLPHPILGTVWCDINNNSIKDPDDTTLKNIEIELYSKDNLQTPISTAITDDEGHYEFTNIKLDSYMLKVKLPSNYNLLEKSNYSSINTKTLLSDIIYNDTNDINILIGLTKCFSIRGIAFLDSYNSGIYEEHYKGINELPITLYDNYNNVVCSTTTSSFMFLDGCFQFTNLSPGRYKIVFNIPDRIAISNPKYSYYGSKANPNTNAIIFNITDHDIINAFVGLKPTSDKSDRSHVVL